MKHGMANMLVGVIRVARANDNPVRIGLFNSQNCRARSRKNVWGTYISAYSALFKKIKFVAKNKLEITAAVCFLKRVRPIWKIKDMLRAPKKQFIRFKV